MKADVGDDDTAGLGWWILTVACVVWWCVEPTSDGTHTTTVQVRLAQPGPGARDHGHGELLVVVVAVVVAEAAACTLLPHWSINPPYKSHFARLFLCLPDILSVPFAVFGRPFM